MTDEPVPETPGGLTLPEPTNENISVAASDLLKLIANAKGTVESVVNSIQITINLPQTDADPESLATGVWVRQVFIDPQIPDLQNNKRIRISFIPDDSTLVEDPTIIDPVTDPGEQAVWENLLGNNPNISINEGASIMRLAKDEESGIVFWIPNDSTKGIICRNFSDQPDNGGLGTDLKAFRKCVRKLRKQGRTLAQACSECGNLL